MATPYKFRHISGPWGLLVTLTVTSRTTDEPGPGIQITDKVSLDIRDPNTTDDDRRELARGLRYVAPAISTATGEGHVAVTVERCDYRLTDYQPEAAAVAIAGWAAEHFGFPALPTEIRYDRQANRYDITLDETAA